MAGSAIKELVQSAFQQIDGVTKPHCRIKTKGGRIHLCVEIKLDGDSQMRTVEALLQKHMRKSLTEKLGIEKLGDINIIATGFKDARAGSALLSSSRQSKGFRQRGKQSGCSRQNIRTRVGQERGLGKSEQV